MGGWVGDREVEKNEAFRMSNCELGLRWVGGWVGRSADRQVGGWVDEWVGRWVRGGWVGGLP